MIEIVLNIVLITTEVTKKNMNTDLLRAQLGHFVTVISTSQNAHNIARLLP